MKDWTEMCSKRESFLLYGTVSPSKNDRNRRHKKRLADASSSDEESERMEESSKMKGDDRRRIVSKKAVKKTASLQSHELKKLRKDISSSEDDDNTSKMSKNAMSIKICMLEEENKKLWGEVSRLRTLDHLSVDMLPKMNGMCENILRQLGECSSLVRANVKGSKESRSESSNKLEKKREAITEAGDSIGRQSRDLAKVGPWIIRRSDDQEVTSQQIQKCNHTSPALLICDLMMLIFTKEERSSSSYTGKVSNFQKAAGVLPKSRLNPDKVEEIKAYALSRFPTLKDADVKKVISRKLNSSQKRICKVLSHVSL